MIRHHVQGGTVTLSWPTPTLADIRAAQTSIASIAVRTPIIRLDWDDAPGEIYLKLELLQPIRAFKIRGAYNVMAALDRSEIEQGVWTASAGNHAQAVAMSARALGVPCTVYVPDTAPRTKIDNAIRYGARVVELPVMEWVDIFRHRGYERATGFFVHPYSDPNVIAGQGVCGLEILEEMPDVETIIAPWGGGGLTTGIASATTAMSPQVRVIASEIETGAPLGPSLEAGHPVEVPYRPSFADGIGTPFVNEEMYDLATRLGIRAIGTTLQQTADALRIMVSRAAITPEGAAATPLAAAINGGAGPGKTVLVISGGNIDSATLQTILAGGTPE
jgi:threonine dehydratase